MKTRSTSYSPPLAGLAILLALALLAAGCTQPAADGHAQTLKITGSTTVLPVAQAAADAFMKDHLNANIQVTGGGSSVGVQAVGEGIAEIGMSSRDLKPEERAKYRDLVDVTIANDGIAIIVHPSNMVRSLTMAQLKEIYAGNTTNWKDVGGPDMTIVVVGRDSASGTREFFSESVMKKQDFTPTQLEKNSNGAVKQTIAQTPGAIGYVGLGYIDADIRPVPINVNNALVEPTIANVVAKMYPIARPLIMITNGAPEGLAKTYLDYLLSPAGQAIVAEEGFVPITA
ncbi:MAG TPA: phosphate ABC transporter substrate-binding protein [Methanoregulaceae archaeon]|jgi:phosphate transport system substrate-binding protein|nr:phosphate ABC transporter substrate-binding protein [Methanoregulaceae archaeon]